MGIYGNFYPRPPRGGRPHLLVLLGSDVLISIHALREEGDLNRGVSLDQLDISIHALREEGDPVQGAWSQRHGQFLSTPSARRATVRSSGAKVFLCYFYPRPPRGGRPAWKSACFPAQRFLSTPSARRATLRQRRYAVHHGISIHALREEGDLPPKLANRMTLYFYPRPPRGGRRGYASGSSADPRFLSTPSARRATSALLGGGKNSLFLSTPSARRATRR